MGKNETICDVLHEPKNKCKQTLESAQYGLGIMGICVDAVILSWYSMSKGRGHVSVRRCFVFIVYMRCKLEYVYLNSLWWSWVFKMSCQQEHVL